MVLHFRRLRAMISKVLVVTVMPPLGATPFPCFFSPSSSVCLIFPGGCSLIVVDRELYSGIPSVCFDSEGGADPATTWKSVGTSACGEEKRGVDGGVCVWCSSKRNFGNFTTNG